MITYEARQIEKMLSDPNKTLLDALDQINQKKMERFLCGMGNFIFGVIITDLS